MTYAIGSHFKHPIDTIGDLAKSAYSLLPAATFPKYDTYAQNLPSIWNIFCAPPEVVKNIYYLGKGFSLMDGELIWYATCKLSANTISLFNSVSNCLFQASFIITFLENQYLHPVAHFAAYIQAMKVAVVSGSILCVIEGLVEANALKRELLMTCQKNFGLPEIPKNIADVSQKQRLLAKLRKRQISLAKNLSPKETKKLGLLLKKIETSTPGDWESDYLSFQLSFFKNKYLSPTISDKKLPEEKIAKIKNKSLQAKMYRLTNRIGNITRQFLFLDETTTDSPHNTVIDAMIAKLDDPSKCNEGISQAKEFLHLMHIHRAKKSILHIIGLVNTALAGAGFFTLFTAAPWAVPIAIIAVSYVFWFLRYGVATGWLTTEKYSSFSFINTIPYWPRRIASLIHNIFKATAASCFRSPPVLKKD